MKLQIFILGCLVVGCLAACGREEQKTLMGCLQGYMNVVQGSGGNPQNMMKTLCTTGRRHLMCLLDVMERCPEFSSMAGSSLPMGMSKETFDKSCNLITGPCSKLPECFAEMPRERTAESIDMEQFLRNMTLNRPTTTPFLLFLVKTGMLCGQMSPVLTCVLDVWNECPERKEYEEQFAQMLNGTQRMFPDDKAMSFQEQLDFVKNECPRAPAGFFENQCLRGHLVYDDFARCYGSFKNVFDTVERKQTCAAYLFLSDCFKTYISTQCGEENAMFMVNNLPLIIDGVNNTICDLEVTTAAPATRQDDRVDLGELMVQQVGPRSALVRLKPDESYNMFMHQQLAPELRMYKGLSFERSFNVTDDLAVMVYDIDPSTEYNFLMHDAQGSFLTVQQTFTLQPRASNSLVLSDAVGQVFELQGKSKKFKAIKMKADKVRVLNLLSFHSVQVTSEDDDPCPSKDCGVLTFSSYKLSGVPKKQLELMFEDPQDFLWAKAHL